MMKKRLIYFLSVLCFISLAIVFMVSSCGPTEQAELSSLNIEKDSLSVPQNIRFGFDLTKYNVEYDTIKKGWTWNNLFANCPINQYIINQTAKRAKDSAIGLRYIQSGDAFEYFTPKNKNGNLSPHLVYKMNELSYVTFTFDNDTVKISKHKRPIEINERMISGVIHKNSNLSSEIDKATSSYTMTADLSRSIEGVYAWTVDFFHLQIGDKFVVVYDEKSIDGEPIGVDKIKYAWFQHAGAGEFAFYYQDTALDVSGYYNEKAKALKRPFLKAPVDHYRISSRYSKSRYHPILHYTRSHLGTDFAAPMNTPIHATADGVVEIASYTGGNGNYVKIRHNSVYETQYLHMHRIAKGIHPGVHVTQGEVIGFVGMTGLATGPHVCYRFWKNGRQVDPFKQKFPDSEPMNLKAKPDYIKYMKPLKKKLDSAIQELKAGEII